MNHLFVCHVCLIDDILRLCLTYYVLIVVCILRYPMRCPNQQKHALSVKIKCLNNRQPLRNKSGDKGSLAICANISTSSIKPQYRIYWWISSHVGYVGIVLLGYLLINLTSPHKLAILDACIKKLKLKTLGSITVVPSNALL